MGLVLLIPGLILWLVDAQWFTGQDTVGLILTVVGAVILIAQILWIAFVGALMRRQMKDPFKGLR
jgi:hypothetical protein